MSLIIALNVKETNQRLSQGRALKHSLYNSIDEFKPSLTVFYFV